MFFKRRCYLFNEIFSKIIAGKCGWDIKTLEESFCFGDGLFNTCILTSFCNVPDPLSILKQFLPFLFLPDAPVGRQYSSQCSGMVKAC
jgi:hypothetical protein